MSKTVLGLITARGASKSVPGKNLVNLAGKPLIAWTIEAAIKSKVLHRIIVSTDDASIAEISRRWNAEVPFMRPSCLAEDDSSHISVVQHAIKWMEEHEQYTPDFVMLLQPTSPLRTPEDITAALSVMLEKNADAVISVCEASRHPIKMFKLHNDETLARYVDSDVKYPRRQVLPKVYEENGAIYLNSRESIMREHTFFPVRTYPYIMPGERSLDIDTPWDIHLAELIMRERTR